MITTYNVQKESTLSLTVCGGRKDTLYESIFPIGASVALFNSCRTQVYHGEVVDWHNKKVSIAFDEPVAGLDTTYTYPELIIGIIRVKFPELVEHLESRT